MRRIIAASALALTFGAMPALSQNVVRVSWVASSDAAANPSLTYNVYRAATCPGQFAKLNSAPVSSTSYLDNTVATGASYCYQVTAVLAGLESQPSNQAVATVPTVSNRQASCGHRGALASWIKCVATRPKRTPPAPQTP